MLVAVENNSVGVVGSDILRLFDVEKMDCTTEEIVVGGATGVRSVNGGWAVDFSDGSVIMHNNSIWKSSGQIEPGAIYCRHLALSVTASGFIYRPTRSPEWLHAIQDWVYVTRRGSTDTVVVGSLEWNLPTVALSALKPHPHEALIAWSDSLGGVGVVFADGEQLSWADAWVQDMAWIGCGRALLCLLSNGRTVIFSIHMVQIASLVNPGGEGWLWNGSQFESRVLREEPVDHFEVSGSRLVALIGRSGRVSISEFGTELVLHRLFHLPANAHLRWYKENFLAIWENRVAVLFPSLVLTSWDFTVEDAVATSTHIIAWRCSQVYAQKIH